MAIIDDLVNDRLNGKSVASKIARGNSIANTLASGKNGNVSNQIQTHLYTNGGEYKLLPYAGTYIGPYHIHPEHGVMVGSTHRNKSHAKLVPVDKNEIGDGSVIY
jgi:hypothetical protein